MKRLTYTNIAHVPASKHIDYLHAGIALPPFRKPVTIKGTRYIDGAMVDNIPTLPLLNRNMDLVIVQIIVHDLVVGVIIALDLIALLVRIVGDHARHNIEQRPAVAVEGIGLITGGLAELHCAGLGSLASADGEDRAARINAILDITRITHILQNALGEGYAIGVDEHIRSGVDVEVDDGQGNRRKIKISLFECKILKNKR